MGSRRQSSSTFWHATARVSLEVKGRGTAAPMPISPASRARSVDLDVFPEPNFHLHLHTPAAALMPQPRKPGQRTHHDTMQTMSRTLHHNTHPLVAALMPQPPTTWPQRRSTGSMVLHRIVHLSQPNPRSKLGLVTVMTPWSSSPLETPARKVPP